MQWANEKEERKENLERWIERTYRILEFAKELRDTLNRANSWLLINLGNPQSILNGRVDYVIPSEVAFKKKIELHVL